MQTHHACADNNTMLDVYEDLNPPVGTGVQQHGAGPARSRSDTDDRPRVDLNEQNVGKGLAQLVLTVVRLVHELLEKQALRRMDAGSLTEDEIDRLGRTLEAQAREIRDMAAKFDLAEEDLNLDLGPLGKAL
ncbi:MAG: gas vesicle protein K [Planctomycetota bacterium]